MYKRQAAGCAQSQCLRVAAALQIPGPKTGHHAVACAHAVHDLALGAADAVPVSYTHLDVYKRQLKEAADLYIVAIKQQARHPLEQGDEAEQQADEHQPGQHDLQQRCV